MQSSLLMDTWEALFLTLTTQQMKDCASPNTAFGGGKVFCLFSSPVFVLEKDSDRDAINSHLKK